MAGSSFRWARSPVAPKIVNRAGSVAPPTRSPTRSGLSWASLGVTQPPRRPRAHRVRPARSSPDPCHHPGRVAVSSLALRRAPLADPLELLADRLQQRVEGGRERLDAVQLELAGDVVQRD